MGTREKYPERNSEIRRRAAAGESCRSVAKDYGISACRVSRICNPVSNKTVWGYGCIYPNIQKWMEANRVTWTRFGELTGVQYGTLQKALCHGLNFSKKTIDGILSATGMTYERAFAKEADV